MPMAPRAAGQALQGLVGLLPAVASGAGAPGQRVGEDTSVLLDRIFERPLRFGEVDLARSLSHPGTGGRLRIVMDKLLRGQPITALILGGSIEIGGNLHQQDDAYFAIVSKWINATFPVAADSERHTFINAARSATSSPYFASCLDDHVPEKMDLVFLQFDINDNMQQPFMNNGHRRSLEVVVRKLLQSPQRPALVYLHFWGPTRNMGRASFWAHTPQPETGLIMHYYGIPAVSLRDVWFHKWARNEPGFRQRDVICNINHPNLLGHQYVADLLIALLQNYAAATALFPASPADREEAAQGLPEPMLPGNWDSATGVCLHDESLKSAMVLAKGFDWVDDTTSYGTHRWGWVTEHIGDSIDLKVNLTVPGHPDNSRVHLKVAILKSYNRMGTLRVECVQNCRCTPLELDGLWNYHMSIKEHFAHDLYTDSPAEECIVRVISTAPERPGGNRVKLAGLVVMPW